MASLRKLVAAALVVACLVGAEGGGPASKLGTRGYGLRARRRGSAAAKQTSSKPKPMKVEALDPSKIHPSQHHPLPGQLDVSLIDTQLTPPNYCYYNLDGGVTQPSVRPPKGGPSLELSKTIVQLLAEPRRCMYYTKYCNQNLTENVDMKGNCCYGDRYVKNFGNDKDPRFVNNLPDLAPGSLGTCAIIGNGDNILRHKWGREIDMHDFVVRFNVKMKGFEQHVGTKTGGLWTKPHYKDRKEDGDQQPTKFHINPKDHTPDLMPYKGKPVLVYGPDLNRKWRQVAYDVYAKFAKEKKTKVDTKPTGGWARVIAMVEMLALGACTRLDLYGFSSGGAKYFAAGYRVDKDHSVNLEHFCHRLLMHTAVKGKLCVYGE